MGREAPTTPILIGNPTLKDILTVDISEAEIQREISMAGLAQGRLEQSSHSQTVLGGLWGADR
tara:strand:+ start:2193 stop:2381 length:189 start_codon:yes stop_codon:yes gene_type:complete